MGIVFLKRMCFVFMTVGTKTQHVCTQIEIHFIAPAYSCTKLHNNYYVHSLHWLMSTGLLFQSAFCRPCT